MRALAAAVLILLAGCGASRNPLLLRPVSTETLPQIRSEFNRDADSPRVILLISPT